MIFTVSDMETTKAALNAGAHALIAQGVEARHVYGTTPLKELIPLVVELAGGIPVAAAGGIVDADDIARAFGLGASAAVLGTCLVVTEESEAHVDYKRALIEAHSGDTVLSKRSMDLLNAPHRTLKILTYSCGAMRASQTPGCAPARATL